jgi:hypothetical protein
LYQIKTPKFTAGFCIDANEMVWEAAPIIKWMKNKPLSFITSYCKNKGWELCLVN